MKRISLVTLCVALLAACGPNQPAATPLPTTTQIPTFAFVSPTPVAQVATAIATRAAQTGDDTAAIEAGRGRYEALECGSCHGANGEGGDAPTLVGLTMEQDDFFTFLRSGGELGTAHQYSSGRLSDRGANNLYLYLQSLSS